VVSEGHKGGEEVQNDRGGDEVDLFPYGVGDPIGAEGREGGGFDRAWAISSLERGTAEVISFSRPLHGRASLGGKN